MENLILPKQYKSELNLHDTQLAIKTVKDFFQALLAQRLHPRRNSGTTQRLPPTKKIGRAHV